MKLYTETNESTDKIRKVVSNLFNTEIDSISRKYVKDEITNQLHQSTTIYINQPKEKYSSVLFDIEYNTIYSGIRFHNQYPIIPPLYIQDIHFLADIHELFKTLFGYDYVKKVVRLEKKMDEDGNVPTIVFFKQSLPRTESLKDFYLEMYRSKYGYKMEYNRYGENIVYIKPYRY
jgi:hypothetical protein